MQSFVRALALSFLGGLGAGNQAVAQTSTAVDAARGKNYFQKSCAICHTTSLGAGNTVIVKPGIFGRVLLESPSFYVSDAEILDQAAKARKLPERIYIGVGTNEGGQPNCIPGDLNKEAVQDVLRFQKILQARKYDERRLKVVVEQCALHNENAWARRFPNAVRFLFGDYSPN